LFELAGTKASNLCIICVCVFSGPRSIYLCIFVSFKRKHNKLINWCSHRTSSARGDIKWKELEFGIDWNWIQINLTQDTQQQQCRDFTVIPRLSYLYEIYEKMLATYSFLECKIACFECLYIHRVRYLYCSWTSSNKNTTKWLIGVRTEHIGSGDFKWEKLELELKLIEIRFRST